MKNEKNSLMFTGMLQPHPAICENLRQHKKIAHGLDYHAYSVVWKIGERLFVN